MKKIRPINAVLTGIVTCLMLIPEISSLAQAGSQWKNLGPYGGKINGLVADAKNPGVLLAGTTTGEIYKTTDNGQNWFYLNTVGKPIRTMIIDTINNNNLYVFARHEVDTVSPQVFISTNGGSSWSSSYSLDFKNVFDAYINPENTTQLYAISRDKITRSINKGLSWSPIRLAEDTSVLTAMAVNPQDPFYNFYVAYINQNDQSVIQRTRDGGYYFETKLTLPENWVITKMFVANDPTATVFAVLGMDEPAYDSVKIIYSKTNGNSWNTAYAAQIDYRFESSEQFLGSYRWLTFPDPNTFVVNLPNGLFKSNDGGMSWYLIPREFQQNNMVQYLTRAPNDTTTFYAALIPSLIKFTLGSSGSLGAVEISNGLSAFPINRMMFADEQNLIVHITDNTNNNEINVLMFSQNLGLDYELLENRTKPVTAFWSNVSDQFVWLEENGACYVSPDMRIKDSINSVFGTEAGIITNAFHLNYIFELSENNYLDSTLMIAAGSSGGFNGIWMSEDDGASWINIRSEIFGNLPIKSISAYPVEIGGISRIRILAATENNIYAMVKGVTSWNLIYSAPGGSAITQISSNFNTVLMSAVSGTNPAIPKLYISRFIPDSVKWVAEDITSSIDQLFALNGPGRIIDVNSAEDGNYLILEHYRADEPTKRKLYKIGYNRNSVRWVEITGSPVDAFLFSSIGTNYTFEGNSFNIYASANNGIWQLKQSPVINHDSVSAAPEAEVLSGETVFDVMYYNQGSAFAYIDTFILYDPAGDFSFAYPEDASKGLFLDIKTGTPLDMKFHPKSTGIKQAVLEAHLLTRSSSGFGDSTIILQTRLTGNVKYSQLGTGLKGDTLNLGAMMLGTSQTKTFYLKNTGTSTLHVYGMAVLQGQQVFELMMDTTEFDLQVNESRPVPVRFEAGLRDTLWIGELWVYSSAYNVQQGHPDSLRKITLTARASGMNWIASDDPVLNQPYTLEVYLTDMKNSAANAVLKYWPIGSPSTALKTKNLTQTPYPDNHLHLSVSIPAEDLTEKGIQFYVEISDGSNVKLFPDKGDRNPYFLKVKIPSPGLNSSSWQTLPGGTSRAAYRLVSFPLELKEKTPLGAFSMSNLGDLGDKGGWQLLRWDRGSNRFIKASDGTASFGNIQKGRSYLLITRDPKTLNSGEGTTVNPDSALTAILSGWNMIANPYTFPVYWLSVVKNNPELDFRKLVVLNEGRFEYVKDKDLAQFRLEPWKGYLYYSDTSAFLIRYPAAEAGLFAKTAFSALATRYSFHVSLQDENNHTRGTIELGEDKSASGSYDIMDRPVLPALDDKDVQILLLSKDGKKLQSDYRSVSENGSAWDLEILNAGKADNLKLAFDEAENLPAGFQIALIDLSKGRTEYVTPGQTVTVSGNQSRSIRYKIIVGSREFIEEEMESLIPTDFYLSQNFPNPFNPVTSIYYGLPSRSGIEIAIYNALGQKVRSLFSGTQNAGQYRITWDGRNDKGSPAASGVYIYRITVRSADDGRSFRQTRKMILIK